MEQGSLADLLTLAKSGDGNKLAEMMAANGGMMGGQDMLSHQISNCCCNTQLRMQDLATGIREQATANQFANQQEFCNIKTQMASNQCEVLAAIQANQAAIIGYMTQEKISNLERENAALTMQLSQNAQTRAIIDALSTKTTTATAA